MWAAGGGINARTMEEADQVIAMIAKTIASTPSTGRGFIEPKKPGPV